MTRPIAGALLVAALAGGIVLGLGLAILAGSSMGSTASVVSGARPGSTPVPGGPAVGVVPPTPSPTPTASPTPTPSPTPRPTPRLVPAPLDGRLVSPELAARHPIAVMVDDLGPARPQSGFSEASVVWHAPAEGGIPRYLMVFGAGSPTAIGPVRSARYYYIAWAAEWRAMYVHAGGSPQALQALRTQGRGQLVYDADEFRYGGTYLWRIRTRSSPHNLYTDGDHLQQLAGLVGATEPPVGPVWRFATDASPSARPLGGRIEIAYPANRVRYDYDRRTNTYLRSVSREATQVDAATGKRVAPKNVVILRMRFGPLSDGNPEKHRLEADVVGTGKAWIATNGRTIAGTWRKDSLTAPTLLFDAAGEPVTLTIGQTFVQVVPLSWDVSIRDGKPVPPSTAVAGPTRPAAR